ncbi:hypothetical protein ABUW04_33060 [Streptacidiphilus sp. N1-10]|uniref:Uncharacterized protein n=1 Tax=Streptacidiphilus jeojiensis TaxID=3229225 RepID=A0ABV6XXS5_9ACTN
MADVDKKKDWGWVGTIGAGLAVAAFFGIHNFSELKAALGGAPTATPAAAVSPTCSPVQKILDHCGMAYFALSGGWQATGPCGETSCPLSGTFVNEGSVSGTASVTFYLHAKASDGTTNEPAVLGQCTAVIPDTPPEGVVSAACTIWSPSTGGVPELGVSENINNPIG